MWNRGAESIKGWAEKEITGRDFAVFYPEDVAFGRRSRTLRLPELSVGSRKTGTGARPSKTQLTASSLHDCRGFGWPVIA